MARRVSSPQLSGRTEELALLEAALERDDLPELLGERRHHLAPLFPELGGSAPADDADSALHEQLARARFFEAVLALLERLGEEAPLVFAVEDLHWSDQATRDLLAFLVRNAGGRVVLVGTCRTDELHRRHPLLAFLAEARRRGVEVIELAPLSREELAAMLAGITGSEPPPDVVERVFRRSDGNPFFAEELVAAARDGDELPASLRETLLVRLAQLSPPARRLLDYAAVARRSVDPCARRWGARSWSSATAASSSATRWCARRPMRSCCRTSAR